LTQVLFVKDNIQLVECQWTQFSLHPSHLISVHKSNI
jgi:hypothetical protein